ncbi:MAG: hypothetical protein GY701_29215 [Sulfitobacter sp.]|nr:hypothetical protein [Sulfitobacter sp.]
MTIPLLALAISIIIVLVCLNNWRYGLLLVVPICLFRTGEIAAFHAVIRLAGMKLQPESS